MGFNVAKAQAAGIDVGDVVDSWAHHLLKERDELRKRELSGHGAAAESDSIKLAVRQSGGAGETRWETLSLPFDGEPIRVSADPISAARNRLDTRGLLDLRLRRALTERLMAAGFYTLDLEGRRAARERAWKVEVHIADVGLVSA